MRAETQHIPLPSGFVPQIRMRRDERSASNSMMWASTSQSMLTWQWTPRIGPALAGTLTWPDSFDAAEAHAASLLAIAEEALVEGCAMRPPPSPGQLRPTTTRRLNDVEDDAVEELRTDLSAAARQWSTLRLCQTKR